MGKRVTQNPQCGVNGREKEYLYCVKNDGYVWAVPRKGVKGVIGIVLPKQTGTERVMKMYGMGYYIDKEGYVREMQMNRTGRSKINPIVVNNPVPSEPKIETEY